MYKIQTKLNEEEIIECLNHISKYQVKNNNVLTDLGTEYRIDKNDIESGYIFISCIKDKLLYEVFFSDVSEEDFNLMKQAITIKEKGC